MLCLGQPWSEIGDFEKAHTFVTKYLGQVEYPMLKVARVGNAKGMRDLYRIQVDHSDELLWDVLS